MNARRKAIQALKEAGYNFKRAGGSHDIYKNEALGAMIPVRHHFTDEDLKIILKEIEQNRRGE